MALVLVVAAVGLPVRPAAALEQLPPAAAAGPGEPAPADPAADPEPPPSVPSPPRPAGGGGPPGGPFGMGGGGPPGYDAAWYPALGVSGQPADLGFVRQSLNLGAPLWRGDADMVMASLSVRNTLFSTDAILPDSLQPFPAQLWSVSFGLNHMHQFSNGWSGGLMGGVGSASDQPFHSSNEMTANLGAMLRVPTCGGRDAWHFMLLYMYGGPVNFPIPMLAYAWNPSEQCRVHIGLPFSVTWQPDDDWTLKLSYMPLNNVNARLTVRVAPRWHLYGAYEFLNESYFLADRTDLEDRFFAFEQRLVAGLRWDVWHKATAEVNGGYSFGRNYGSGASQWSALTDQVDVAPGPFLGIRLGWKF